MDKLRDLSSRRHRPRQRGGVSLQTCRMTNQYQSYTPLFRQGLMLYDHIPNCSDERVRPLMERFLEMLMEQRVFKGIFGVI